MINKKVNFWLSVAVICITFYPAIGSVISWCATFENVELKRTLQLIVLLAGVFIAWRLRWFWVNKENSTCQIKSYGIAFAAFYLYLIFQYIYSPTAKCTVYTILSPLVASALFSQSVVALMLRLAKWSKKTNREPIKENLENIKLNNIPSALFHIIILAGWVLAFVVWYKGPRSSCSEISLNMKSMPVMLGSCFIAIYVLSTWRARISQTLLASPWLYLAICTTSRIVLVLISLFVLGSLVDVFLQWKNSRPYKVRLATTLFSACLFISFICAPAIIPKYFKFPYRHSSEEANSSNEWVSRWSRFLRIFFLEPDTNAVRDSGRDIERQIRNIGSIRDDRYQMITKALTEIALHPTGTWPQEIQISTNLDEHNGINHNYIYIYPHNFFLELAFQFGWIPTIIVFLGLFTTLSHAVRGIYLVGDSLDMFVGMLFLSEFVKVQVSGSLPDDLGFLLLFFFITNRNSSRQTSLLKAPPLILLAELNS